MSYRFMRVIVMFDLPMLSASEKREYTKFRKYLLKNGFLMMQESIYCKLAQNAVSADLLVQQLRKNKPSGGLVQVMKVTEKQYNKMEIILGEANSEVLDSDERLVIF